jgi:hypothetical protein
LVPSTFKGVEKEEPFLRMDPDYLRPEGQPEGQKQKISVERKMPCTH